MKDYRINPPMSGDSPHPPRDCPGEVVATLVFLDFKTTKKMLSLTRKNSLGDFAFATKNN